VISLIGASFKYNYFF